MTELEMLEREKYCEVYDAHSAFARDLNRELGAKAEAVLARLWDKHYSHKTERRLVIRKWETVTLNAKNRRIEATASCETTPQGHP